MTVRQFPQLGDVVATRAHDQGSAVILPGAVLVARRDEPQQTAVTDLSNVVPFARPRRSGTPAPFPLSSVTADDRPAPCMITLGFGRSAALLVGSLALHAALLATFWHRPQPMASVGIEVMTVEITLGATTPAGLAPMPGQQETVQPPSHEARGEGEEVKEQSRAATMLLPEVEVAARETAPEVTQQETPPEAETVEPVPPEQRPETTTAETPVSTQPVERPQRVEQPRPKVQAVQAPDRKRIAAPTEKKPSQKKQTAAATATDPSQGIGIGRSDKSANYKGIVRAHLVRYKRTPSSGSGRGMATVQFLIDGRGHVTSARLVKSSGIAAFDQEIVAMARRASPFPPPPDGRGHDFTVSVNFEVR